jgi:deazaflavin-dependent oxidoreductase (nitroreductase family)
MATADLDSLATEQFCYLTTRGRRTGLRREIEIWFGLDGRTLYMLSGGRDRSDWVRNILADPKVTVRIGDSEFAGKGRAVEADTAEDALARRLLLEKYSRSYSGDLTEWGRTALPVAIEFDGRPAQVGSTHDGCRTK